MPASWLEEIPLWMFMIFAGLLGAGVGSFLNVLIHRVPRAESIVKPGSHCPVCNRAIKPWNNIPLLSWLLLGGRCPDCKTKIPIRYFLVELAGIIVAIWPLWLFGPSLDAVGGMLLGWHLIAIAVIDLETLTIPDHLVLPMGLCGLLYSGLRDGWTGLGTSVLAGVIGAAFPLLILLISRVIMRREGVGSGDVTMSAGFSTYLRPVTVAFSLAIAAAMAVLGSVLFAIFRKKSLRGREIPFGPWLALGAWISYLYGEQIVWLYVTYVLERVMG